MTDAVRHRFRHQQAARVQPRFRIMIQRPPATPALDSNTMRIDAERVANQRSAALIQANHVRERRAWLKRRLKSGEESLAARITAAARIVTSRFIWPTFPWRS